MHRAAASSDEQVAGAVLAATFETMMTTPHITPAFCHHMAQTCVRALLIAAASTRQAKRQSVARRLRRRAVREPLAERLDRALDMDRYTGEFGPDE